MRGEHGPGVEEKRVSERERRGVCKGFVRGLREGVRGVVGKEKRESVGSCVAGCCGSGATVLPRPLPVDFREASTVHEATIGGRHPPDGSGTVEPRIRSRSVTIRPRFRAFPVAGGTRDARSRSLFEVHRTDVTRRYAAAARRSNTKRGSREKRCRSRNDREVAKGGGKTVSGYGMWRRLEPNEIVTATNPTYPRRHDATRFNPKRARFSNLELGPTDLKAESFPQL